MDQFGYRDILEMVPHANYNKKDDNNMPLLRTFQQDNEPKHTSKLVN